MLVIYSRLFEALESTLTCKSTLPPTRLLALVAARGPEFGSTFSNKRLVAESARGVQKRDTFSNLSLVAESARSGRSWEHFQQQEACC
ncbi:hypothetical protein SLEP1_g50927 [Rubroshorea leprosula]|uniref:Uncharacterized protein n=1 Tax=Rubroshorea leprosula TaxID=152421 RepID=A0AAV5M2F9_9ROSI|nr:hypothetical protein SLEP1_g50927 [Rubroshorea leprosula]